ncbi:hypothetical protein GIV20_21520 [Pseudomonas tremae]|nr:hypothetical protein [Pseudomonas tremae]MCF5810635.1 hypothetical protein [Pseudomonas tremae]
MNQVSNVSDVFKDRYVSHVRFFLATGVVALAQACWLEIQPLTALKSSRTSPLPQYCVAVPLFTYSSVPLLTCAL